MSGQPLSVASVAERIQFLREAAVVERMHTEPHVGSYTVGLHSYNALNLILVLNPAPSPSLIRAIMWHDAAERLTGDIPAPIKWKRPALKAMLSELEQQIDAHYGLVQNLSTEDWRWLKAVDGLELWLWCDDQVRRGNQDARYTRTLLQERFARDNSEGSPILKTWPKPVWDYYMGVKPERTGFDAVP